MIFWSLAIVVTAVACAALYYAGAGQRVNAAADVVDSPEVGHLRLQLKEIEADAAAGRLGAPEAVAAKGELARELMRIKAKQKPVTVGAKRSVIVVATAATALLAFGVYAVLGRPDLPAQPLEQRADLQPPEMSLDDAIARIEAQLLETPDDVRGWTVIAPAYMQLGRFADAVNALRRVIELDGPTADRETDLGEAVMMTNDGSMTGEPLALFESAAARDPTHVRSRYYIAEEAMARADYEAAEAQWQALLALSTGGEPWLSGAQAGLAAAEQGLRGEVPDTPEIAAMVESLAARLDQSGGTIEEWTRLVRSYLVLGETERAQAAYQAARAAYPDSLYRTELDVLAADNGLVAN
ncbi:MAG: c-type cytochrome biogenesis protein CcmI [Devosia sp.]